METLLLYALIIGIGLFIINLIGFVLTVRENARFIKRIKEFYSPYHRPDYQEEKINIIPLKYIQDIKAGTDDIHRAEIERKAVQSIVYQLISIKLIKKEELFFDETRDIIRVKYNLYCIKPEDYKR